MSLSYKERFFSWSNGVTVFAPSTLGCAAMTMTVDRTEFKKSAAEKLVLYGMKKMLPKTRGHKFQSVMKGSF